MLRVNYKVIYGHFYLKGNNGKYLKCDIHQANCLFATVYHDKSNHTNELVNFACDIPHLKRCFKKGDSIYTKDECKGVTLYTNLPKFQTIASIIALSGITVKIIDKK